VYLLDTNVVSELRKVAEGKANARVTAWQARLGNVGTFLSVITLQELHVGVLRIERRDATQGAALRGWLEQRVLPEFAGRILPISQAIAMRCARLHVPDPRPINDALIASTALVHDLTVVTRNAADFEPLGVRILNPWEFATR